MATDASEDVLEVLRGYFSAPIAKAIVSTTLKKVAPGKALDAQSLPVVCEALERVLPAYISDSTKRSACVSALRHMSGAKAESHAPGAESDQARLPDSVTTTRVHVRTEEDAANAADVGKDLCRTLGFSDLDQTKVATIIAELARNILHYAKTGEVAVSVLSTPRRGIEVIAKDKGPGITNIDLVMSTQFKSKTGMGMGLKGSKRIMDFFDLQSTVGEGTTVVVRKFL